MAQVIIKSIEIVRTIPPDSPASNTKYQTTIVPGPPVPIVLTPQARPSQNPPVSSLLDVVSTVPHLEPTPSPSQSPPSPRFLRLSNSSKMGLINFSDNCYLNAVFQCLFHCQLFVDYYFADQFTKEVNTSSTLHQTLKDILSLYWSFPQSAIKAYAVLQPLNSFCPFKFSVFKQEDASYFFNKLMDALVCFIFSLDLHYFLLFFFL